MIGMREYFCAYHSMLGGTRKLSDAECGRLFRALLRYSAGEDVGLINLQGREEVLFDVYSQQIDRDVKAYEASIVRSRENGSKGGRPKKNPENPVGFSENPENPGVFLETQKTQDKDKDKGKDEDKDDNPKKRFDNHWRTSARARAAVAQVIIDSVQSGPLGLSPYPNLHSYVCKVLAAGHEPDTILDAIAGVRDWTEAAVWLSMHGGADDEP